MFDKRHWKYDFYCPKALNYQNTSTEMTRLWNTYKSSIALPEVGVASGQTPLVDLFFCFVTNIPWPLIFWDMASLLPSHFELLNNRERHGYKGHMTCCTYTRYYSLQKCLV